MYGYVSMAKRKSDIFTVIEAVPNWFEASEDVARAPEVARGTANWVQAHDDMLASTYVASEGGKGTANWVQAHDDTVASAYVASEGVRELPTGFRPTKTRQHQPMSPEVLHPSIPS